MEPSPAEQAVIKAVRRAKLFVFLRQHRHELFDEQFQAELAETYVDSPKGQPPVPPARLALATILQAYTGVSDDEVIEATVMDRRWQLVLDCLGAEEPPFSKGTLVGFRKRLIERDLDRRLVERTVELAAPTKGFGARALRAALDSSPLWGAGRVEDTFNLMGHALRKALGVIAVLQGRGQAAGTAVVAAQAGVPELAASSLKAALDGDWDDPAARDAGAGPGAGPAGPGGGVHRRPVPATRPRPRRWRSPARSATRTWTCPARRRRCAAAWPKTGGSASKTARCGTAASPARSCSTATSGTCCATWTPAWCPRWASPPANAPEASVTGDITADLDAAGRHLAELHIDRAYLSSALVRDRGPDLAIFCKAWRVRNTGGRFAKDQFTLDFAAGQLTCPAGVSMPFEPGKTVRFPKAPAPPARCGPAAPPAQRAQRLHPPRRGAAGRAAPAASRPRQAARSCANASRSSTPSPTSGTGKAAAPATAAPARTCSTCAASPSSTTSTSSPASPSPTLPASRLTAT